MKITEKQLKVTLRFEKNPFLIWKLFSYAFYKVENIFVRHFLLILKGDIENDRFLFHPAKKTKFGY